MPTLKTSPASPAAPWLLVASVCLCAAISSTAALAAPKPEPAPIAPTPSTKKPVVAAADWIAADALRLLAGDTVEIRPVPGLAAPLTPEATPTARATKPAAPANGSPDQQSDAAVRLSDQARNAIDSADALLSALDAPGLHAAAKELCAVHGALATAIRPQLRALRADGTLEPAFWTDAALWARTVSVTRQTLAKLDPNHDPAAESLLKERANTLRSGLITLNDEMLNTYATLPHNAPLIVGADGLGQVARVHHLDLHLVPRSLDSKEDQEAMRTLVELIIESHVPAVFPVDGRPNSNIDELVKRVKARGGTITIAPALHVDTPAPNDDGSAGAVERMIRHNARTIRDAFAPKGLPLAK